jgi:hypothetical protein
LWRSLNKSFITYSQLLILPSIHSVFKGELLNLPRRNILFTFIQIFPDLPITELLGYILEDETYKEWSQIRNVLAHRAATAGRTIQYQGPIFFQSSELPLSVRQWGSDLPLDATTAYRYDWLRETINKGLEEVEAFTVQQLAYTEDQLARWLPLPS